jgi:methyl-accepting chemotaxis protein
MFNSRTKAELAALRAEVAMLRQAQAGVHEEMLTLSLDAENRVSAANRKMLTALGYTETTLIGRRVDELVPDYVKQLPCYRTLQGVLSKGGHVSDLYRLTRVDGSESWLRGMWQTLLDADGRIARSQFSCMDVTPAVITAKENAGLIEALLRSTAVIEFNLKGEVITANERFLQAMGYTSQLLLRTGRGQLGELSGFLGHAQPWRIRRRPLQAYRQPWQHGMAGGFLQPSARHP